MPNSSQVQRTINLDISIIELHNLARKLELNPLTKDVSAKLRTLANELSELKPVCLLRLGTDKIKFL